VSEQDFKDRLVLVTGGSRGIGRACCERLARAGANIAINYNSREDAALETASRVEAAGGKAMIVQADVTDEQAVNAMVAQVNEKLGPIDMLVNNAGIFEYMMHDEMTLDHWKRTLDCNLTSLYIVTWAVREQMIERKFGRIVNMSSISALRPRPYGIAYAASKAGIIAFTQSASDPQHPHQRSRPRARRNRNHRRRRPTHHRQNTQRNSDAADRSSPRNR